MSAVPAPRAPRLRQAYSTAPIATVLADPSVLAVIGFGSNAPRADDARAIAVALEPVSTAPLEVWHATGSVQSGTLGGLAYAHDGALLFAAMEVDERHGDVQGAAEDAYAALRERTAALGYPHLLRVWNYLDDITLGDGDAERYKRFCVGRARGLGDFAPTSLPAATAIGRVHATGRLQVYWLASREPGRPLENPRQVSAYHYPRQYGPQPPSFARAMLPADGTPLLLSGTAAIRGHESLHAASVDAQLDETHANIGSLVDVARRHRPELPATLGPGSHLKAYVREGGELAHVDAALAARLPEVPRVVLHARVCRRELRLEIDGAHA